MGSIDVLAHLETNATEMGYNRGSVAESLTLPHGNETSC